MKSLKDWLWPIIAGLAIGAAILSFNGPVSTISSTAYETTGFKLAVNKAAPAVVSLYVNKPSTSNQELEADPMYRLYRNLGIVRPGATNNTVLGSGVIIREDGYIVTNRHVIAGSRGILAVLADGREAQATLVGEDSQSDLAVLKIQLEHLPALNVNREVDLFVGDIVLAIGNPFGVGLTVTQGIISATERIDADSSTQVLIQTDAAINPGNSGGPLINVNGDLIGISTSVLGSQTEGISFALPMDTTRFVVNSLIEHGRVIRGWLGIGGGAISSWRAKALNIPEGLAIVQVAPNSPAQFAGLMPGDIITGIASDPNATNAGIAQRVALAKPGEQLRFTIWRESNIMSVELTVGTQPSTD